MKDALDRGCREGAVIKNFVPIGLGCVVAFVGYQEFGLLRLSTEEPVPTELALLEGGAPPPNLHLEIGHHWKVWDELIYSYSLKGGQSEAPDTRVDYAYYPILSDEHSYFDQVDALGDRYGTGGTLLEQDIPAVGTFAVLVRTRAFKRLGEIPSGSWEDAENLRGLVVNRVRTLGHDEQPLLLRSFPSIDLTKIIILEEGRRPSSRAYALGMLGCGGALSLLGVGLSVRPRHPRKAPPGDSRTPAGASPPPPVSNPLTKVQRGQEARESVHPSTGIPAP